VTDEPQDKWFDVTIYKGFRRKVYSSYNATTNFEKDSPNEWRKSVGQIWEMCAINDIILNSP
jgi:hypothetical protein